MRLLCEREQERKNPPRRTRIPRNALEGSTQRSSQWAGVKTRRVRSCRRSRFHSPGSSCSLPHLVFHRRNRLQKRALVMNLPTRKIPSCDKVEERFLLAEMCDTVVFSDLLYLTNICDTTALITSNNVIIRERVYSLWSKSSTSFQKEGRVEGGTSRILYQRISENIFPLTRHVIFSKSVNRSNTT